MPETATASRPGEHMERRPVHDRNQVQKAALGVDAGDVGAPHLIRAIDRQPLDKMGIHPMPRMRVSGSRRAIDLLQPHGAHQAPRPVTADLGSLVPQLARHPATAEERILRKQLVDLGVKIADSGSWSRWARPMPFENTALKPSIAWGFQVLTWFGCT